MNGGGNKQSEGYGKPYKSDVYAGVGLKHCLWGQTITECEHLHLKPYWGKPAVRNFRELAGDMRTYPIPCKSRQEKLHTAPACYSTPAEAGSKPP